MDEGSVRPLQFGLASLFVATLVVGVVLAIPADLWIPMLFVSPVWLLLILLAYSAARATLRVIKRRSNHDLL